MYFLYCIHIGILLPNIVWWIWSNVGTLVLVLILAMLNNEKSIKKKKEVLMINNNFEKSK